MTKRKSKAPKVPTVAEMVAFLEDNGGKYSPYYEVPGGTFPHVLTKAVAQGKVQITTDGGLELIGED
jgi:hypothetical protein